MRTVLILCLLLMCFAQGHGNFADFMKNLPGDISRAFTGTWDSIIEAIKRPVRTKRIGPASRKKALRTMTTAKPYIWSSAPDTDKIIDDLEKKVAENRDDNKLKLPLILLPQHSSLDIWMKRPYPTVAVRTTPKPGSTTVNTFKFYKERDSEDGVGRDESYIFRPMVML